MNLQLVGAACMVSIFTQMSSHNFHYCLLPVHNHPIVFVNFEYGTLDLNVDIF